MSRSKRLSAAGRVNFFEKSELTMTIKEKIACSNDVTRLTLFKEGMFIKAYNKDAMVFEQYLKAYGASD